MPTSTPTINTLSPEHVILGLLRQAPAHGYELHQRITRDLGELWHLRFNQIYGILHRLEAEGLVIGTMEKGANAPSRRCYRITPYGLSHFESWLTTPTPSSVRAIRVEFMTRLYFARQQASELAERLLIEQVDATRNSLAQQRAALEQTGIEEPFNHLGIALRVRTLAGVLEWLQDCQVMLR